MTIRHRTIERLAQALRLPRYEVIPLKGTEEQVLEHVPKEAKLTVTASPQKGMEDTLRLAEQLASQAYHVAPHLSARLVEDSAHVEEILLQLHEVGIRDAFVVGATLRSPLASLLARLGCWSRCPGSGMSLRKSALPATRRATPSSKMRP
jgi:methylenetetrahydrofolate reductase (NADPH)